MSYFDIHALYPYGLPPFIGSVVMLLLMVNFTVRGYRKRMSMGTALFCLAVFVWMLAMTIIFTAPEPGMVILAVYFLGWLMIPPLYINLALSFRGGSRRYTWYVLTAFASLWVVGMATGSFHLDRGYFGHIPKIALPLSVITNTLYFTTCATGMSLFYREYLAARGNLRRNQARMLWLGTSFAFIVAITESIMVVSPFRIETTDGIPVDDIGMSLAVLVAHAVGYAFATAVIRRAHVSDSLLLRPFRTMPGIIAGFALANMVNSFVLVNYCRPIYPWSTIGVLVAVMTIGYAILKYKLIDVAEIFRRILVYILLSAIFLTFYTVIIYFAYGRTMTAPSSIIMALLVVFLFNPASMLVQRMVNRLFFSNRYNYQKTIRDVSAKLVTVLDFHRIVDIIRETIVITMQASTFALILYDHNDDVYVPVARHGVIPDGDVRFNPAEPSVNIIRLANREIFRDDLCEDGERPAGGNDFLRIFDAFNAAIVIPMTYKGFLYGILCIGDKESGDIYNRQDVELLQVLANQAVIALDNARLYELAITDGLTHLFIAKYFSQRLLEEIGGAVRNRRSLSLLMLDIDHFKSINDDYGHQTGDAILRQTASILRDQVRSEDIVSRYGGEEFTVILPETDNLTAMAVAERIRRAMEEYEFERGLRCRISVGVATLDGNALAGTVETPAASRPGKTRFFEEIRHNLIRRSDEALYAAKRGGRNRCMNSGVMVTAAGDDR